jgi:cell division protein FtsB
MRALTPFLPMLVCAGGMLLCMKMMSRGSKSGASCHDQERQQGSNSTELAELHEEITRLRAEVRLMDRDSEPRA